MLFRSQRRKPRDRNRRLACSTTRRDDRAQRSRGNRDICLSRHSSNGQREYSQDGSKSATPRCPWLTRGGTEGRPNQSSPSNRNVVVREVSLISKKWLRRPRTAWIWCRYAVAARQKLFISGASQVPLPCWGLGHLVGVKGKTLETVAPPDVVIRTLSWYAVPTDRFFRTT